MTRFNHTESVNRYRPEIDGLRALAVISVIIHHFNKDFIPSGFLGVDIFFVISGFVVTSSLSTKPEQPWKDYLLTFYSRRIKRLLPALSTCVLITSIVGCLFVYQPTTSLRTGIAALVGSSNLYLYRQSTDYFGQTAEMNLFTQTWSLGVEEQFYLVFPILLGMCGFSRKKKRKGDRNLFLTVLVLSILSLISYCSLSQNDTSAAFFLMPARFWELGAGCITFLTVSRFSKYSSDSAKTLLAPLSTLFLVAIMFVSKESQISSTIATVCLVCILLWSFDQKSFLSSVFSSKWMVQVGLWSYSLYLWHWSVLVISRWTSGIQWFTVPFQLLLIFGLALLSYKYIEKPLRSRTWRPQKIGTIKYGISICFASCLTLYGLEISSKGDKLFSIGSQYILKSDIVPPQWWNDQNGNYIDACHNSGKFNQPVFESCLNKYSTISRRSIFLFGDSHGRNILKGLEAAFPTFNVNYATMGSLCSSIPIEIISPEVNYRTNCSEYTNSINTFVKKSSKIKPGDIIVIGVWIENIGKDDTEKWQSFKDHIESMSYELNKKQAYLILTSDVPGISVDIRQCLKNRLRVVEPSVCKTTIEEARYRQKELYRVSNLLETELNNFYFLDYLDQLCTEGICSAYLENKVLYVDSGHLPDEVSSGLGDFITTWAKSNGIVSSSSN